MNCGAIILSRHLRSIVPLLTVLRDRNTGKVEFVKYANRLMTILSEEGLAHMGQVPCEVWTPNNLSYSGSSIRLDNIVAVSIIRAGDSLLDRFLQICPEAKVGKILIQRDEDTALPVLFYRKLPNLVDKRVVIVDPMLATGGSANAAIKVLLESGASEDSIVFLCVVACPEGVAAIASKYPKVQVIAADMDDGLNEKAYIVPGLGDYGDRYFGT